MISNIYAQCDDYNELNCSNDDSCDWVEDIETGNCGNLSGDDCELNPECNWNCDWVDDYMGWCNYSCDGGPYEIDSSYCEESATPPPPECSEMSQIQCNNNSDCQWTEDTAIGDCDDINNGSDCYAIDECTWYSSGNYGYGFDGCYGGSYEIDSSYCEELSGDDGGLADPTVFLSIGNDIDISNRIIYIDMISEEEVGGFQFLLSDTPDNITITGAGGGITEESGFSISSSEMGIVVAFSFTGSTILPGEYNLFEYYFEINNEELTTLCIEDIVFSDPNGGAIEVDFAGCISSSFENMNMGDTNGDGALDILDIVIIVDNIITGGEYLQVADMNNDESIDVLDIIIIVGIILDS